MPANICDLEPCKEMKKLLVNFRYSDWLKEKGIRVLTPKGATFESKVVYCPYCGTRLEPEWRGMHETDEFDDAPEIDLDG